MDNIKLKHKIIIDLIKDKSSILELGSGDGTLIYLLEKIKQCTCHGIEINEQEVYKAVSKGLNVLHQDIDSGLSDYNDNSFDYVIFDESLQQVKNFDNAFKEALRVGRKVIIVFSNFAYYKSRAQLFFQGKAPVTKSLPYVWHQSPNIHFFSILDFKNYCKKNNLTIEKKYFINQKKLVKLLPNLFAETVIFLLTIKK
jgi:methionine biosynthesis protein MetW